MKKRSKRRKRCIRFRHIFMGAVLLVLFGRGLSFLDDVSAFVKENADYRVSIQADQVIASFAGKHDLQISEYPEELVDLLERNPETKEFVLNYPLKKDLNPTVNLDEYKNCDSVPLLLQWDERWGYHEYGADVMGLSGCGPTCLSMVCIYLLDDTDLNPKYIADFSEANGYCVPGNGSAWTLISEGGEKLGLDVEELSLDEDIIRQNLEAGNAIICIMGPGDFTTSGHFIVMVDYVDGMIRVNDPNSEIRSEKLWEYEEIKNQIRNLWVCRSRE